MAYFVTFACHRRYLTEEQRDEYHSLSYRVGLSMDHELFTEDMIVAGAEAILYVPFDLSRTISLIRSWLCLL